MRHFDPEYEAYLDACRQKLEENLDLDLLDVYWHPECPVTALLCDCDITPETEAYLFGQHLHCPLCRSAACGLDEPLEADRPGHPEFEATMRYIREVEVPKIAAKLDTLRILW